MKAVNYFPLKKADEITMAWIRSLDRKRSWKGGWGKTALLVLDMQRAFTDPSSHAFVPSSLTVLENIGSLKELYQGPVIFTRHSNRIDGKNLMTEWWKDPISGPMAEIDPSIVSDGHTILEKEHYSAFHDTDLEIFLKDLGIETVIISGVLTDLCCETTARDAFMRGFKVVFLADCTGTETEERHLKTLNVISRAFGEVLTWKELMLRS